MYNIYLRNVLYYVAFYIYEYFYAYLCSAFNLFSIFNFLLLCIAMVY